MTNKDPFVSSNFNPTKKVAKPGTSAFRDKYRNFHNPASLPSSPSPVEEVIDSSKTLSVEENLPLLLQQALGTNTLFLDIFKEIEADSRRKVETRHTELLSSSASLVESNLQLVSTLASFQEILLSQQSLMTKVLESFQSLENSLKEKEIPQNSTSVTPSGTIPFDSGKMKEKWKYLKSLGLKNMKELKEYEEVQAKLKK